VENYIGATFGTPASLSPSGLPLSAGGIPLFSDVGSVKAAYKIVENVAGFSYAVRIVNTITVASGMARELARVTPAGITFSIVSVADPFTSGVLTVSGNEITDTLRTAQGPVDGFAAGANGGTGIYKAHSNKAINTQFSSVTTGWVSTGTLSVDATQSPPFPSHSALKSVVGATTTTEMTLAASPAAGSGQIWTYSCWVKGTSGQQVKIGLYGYTSGGANSELLLSSVITLTGSWQRMTATFTLANGTTTAVSGVIQPVGAQTYYMTAPMLSQGNVDAPYIANNSTTNGSFTTRSAGRVQAPAAMFAGLQGWVAVRLRMGFSSPSVSSSYLFNWGSDANNALLLFTQGTNTFQATNAISGVGTGPNANDGNYTAGQFMTVIMAWDATKVYLSVDGQTFVSVTPTGGRVLPSDTNFDIGSLANTSQLGGSVVWVATGEGTLSNADAATLFALGNSPPTITTFAGSTEKISSSIDLRAGIPTNFDRYDDAA
jgi:hypothetical protein